ncbi:MAG: hypothetical protein QOJ79_3517 [Actinomycetota bacterium]|nr:hypothetical protein [Actinomycetota bacterium]
MRQGVVIVMSGVSVLVVGVGVRAGRTGVAGLAVSSTAPAGVVDVVDVPQPVTPSAAVTRTPAARPAAARTQPASPAAVPRRAVVAAPPRPVATRAAPAPSPRRTAAAATTTVVNGAPADTQYGPVQVQISIRGHRIIHADAIDYPQGSRRDQEINSYAIPQLDQETVNAQSANIDTVSGATYTSDGYRQSLQSALDAAHRAGAW